MLILEKELYQLFEKILFVAPHVSSSRSCAQKLIRYQGLDTYALILWHLSNADES